MRDMIIKKIRPLSFYLTSLIVLILVQPITSAIEDELILANIPEEIRGEALEKLNNDAENLNEAIAEGGQPPSTAQLKLKKQLMADDLECEEVKCIFGYKLFRINTIRNYFGYMCNLPSSWHCNGLFGNVVFNNPSFFSSYC